MKKLIIPASAIVLALSFSAFTGAKRTTSNFYEYTSSSTAQADIKNINNYVAADPGTDPCSGAQDVCGVTLSTARNLGQTPVSSEFTAEQSNLWTSQQNHSAQDSNIEMKN